MINSMKSLADDLASLTRVLSRLRGESRIGLALLFGSAAAGVIHARSDIDLAIYLTDAGRQDESGVIDALLMARDRPVSVLRLDDEDESPFVVQEALRGRHLVPPEPAILQRVTLAALHESESIRFRREMPKR